MLATKFSKHSHHLKVKSQEWQRRQLIYKSLSLIEGLSNDKLYTGGVKHFLSNNLGTVKPTHYSPLFKVKGYHTGKNRKGRESQIKEYNAVAEFVKSIHQKEAELELVKAYRSCRGISNCHPHSRMLLTIATPPATIIPRTDAPFMEAAPAKEIGLPVLVGAVETPVEAMDLTVGAAEVDVAQA